MGDKFKIELESKSRPINFSAFDVLYIDKENLMGKSLLERKKLLSDNINENERLSVARYIETKGIELYRLTKKQDLEGIVAKLKTSKYIEGIRTKEWLKIKTYIEDDLVVLGYKMLNGKIKDLVLGYYNKLGKMNLRGSVYFGVSKIEEKSIMKIKNTKPHFPIDDVIWIEPKLVCTVKYMQKTEKGGMRQPVFKGLREDKIPSDCVF